MKFSGINIHKISKTLNLYKSIYKFIQMDAQIQILC